MKSIEKTRGVRLYSQSKVCAEYRLSRDAYHKNKHRLARTIEVTKEVVKLVRQRRDILPREGCRKLYESLETEFLRRGLKVGRDKLFTILREHEMLVLRKRSSCRTTDSYHRFHKYGNLIKALEIRRPNQVWVSDITYIRTVKGFCYLALITDLYSRKIVGYDLSDSLELSGCLKALSKAFRKSRSVRGLIHHSDRGVQYCSNQYVAALKKRGVSISMTEENHCYENAVAERVNGILKDEFFLDQTFSDITHAQRAAKNAIKLYNELRLHVSLGYKTPESVYKMIA